MFTYITFEMFTHLTNAHIFSHIDYCLPIYSCRSDIEINDLQCKISKFVLSFAYKTKTLSKILKTKSKNFYRIQNFDIPKNILHNLYEKCNFFTVSERILYYSSVQMFKFLKFGSNCVHFDLLFQFDFSTSPRFENLINSLDRNSETFKRSIKYRFVNIWNQLPNDLRNLRLGFTKFKKLISTHILEGRLD